MKEYKYKKADPIAMEAVRELSNSLLYTIIREQFYDIDLAPRKLSVKSTSIDNIIDKINNLSSPLSEIKNNNVHNINIHAAFCKMKKEHDEIWG